MNTNGRGLRIELGSGWDQLLCLYGFVYECPGLSAGFGGCARSEEQFPTESGIGCEGGGEAVQHRGAIWPGGGVDRRAINRRG
jgi:hypothetical protein